MSTARWRFWAPAVLGGILLLAGLVAASVFAAGVTKEYQSDDSLTAGMLVSSVPEKAGFVVPTNLDNKNRVFGIVVNADQSVITLGETGTDKVLVAHDGSVEVLVSDLAGTINAGDLLTVSPLTGFAQKATRDPLIIGTALSGFSGGSDDTIGTADVNTENGEQKKVKLGKVTVQFEVRSNPDADNTSRIPSALQGIADTVGGKPVSGIRIVIALVVLMLMLVVASVLLYTAIHTALIAIGRNPLSRGGVYRAMFQVFGLVGLVMAVGLSAAFLILKI